MRISLSLVIVGVLSLLSGCGGKQGNANNAAGTGGVLGVGGGIGTGGALDVGGGIGTGGALDVGGGAGTGGAAIATGGALGVGGGIGTGGAAIATGGAKSTGGTRGVGGATGSFGTAMTGGAKSTGGATANAGGKSSAAGGAATIGGASSSAYGGNSNMAPMTQSTLDQINDASCSGWAAEGEVTPANIEFIVDSSGSMRDLAPNGTNGRSKWEITKTALESNFDKMPPSISVGLLVFPNKMTKPNTYTSLYQETGDIDACVNVSAMVPLVSLGAVGSAQRNALASTLDAVAPQGGTPMADAYMYAISDTYSNNPLMLGAKFAVFITDGQPTIQYGCRGTGEEGHPVDIQPLFDAIENSNMNNQVRTFVIGSPGSESQSLTGADGRSVLSQAAIDGDTKLTSDCSNSGTPNYCHLDVSIAPDFAAAFDAALEHIISQVSPCAYRLGDAQLAGQVVNPDKVNVIYHINGSDSVSDMLLVGSASTADCPEGNGWYLDPSDPKGDTVRLCPMTCDTIRQDAGAVVDIRGGCGTVRISN